MNHGTTTLAFLVLLSFAALTLTGCENSDCGPGTHEEAGRCVPDIPIGCASPGLEYIDGRCQVSASVCPEGSEWDAEAGRCSGSVTAPSDTGVSTQDTTTTLDTSVGDASDDATGDVAPDLPPAQVCGENSPTGTVCLSGLLLDWSTGQPLTGDEPIGIILDDLTLRNVFPDKLPFGVTGLQPGGAFLFSDVPSSTDDGPLTDMILIADEAPEVPLDDWQRTLTGVPESATDGTAYPGQTAFIVPNQLVLAWDTLLGRSNETSLSQVGFLLVRVLTVTPQGLAPVPGATVQNIDPEADGAIEKRYLNDGLTGFRAQETTGATGSVLLIGAPVGRYTAGSTNFAFRDTLGGTFPGLAVTTVIVGEAQ